MNESELMAVLRNSLYPGAADDSIKMVLGYCKAAGLDPMQKPVHIVPMQVSTGRQNEDGYDIKEKRDVIMPGIGLYRTQAARSGQYAGVSEPEFGPLRTMKYRTQIWTDGPNGKRAKSWIDADLEYPEWCRVTVRRLLGNTVVEFTAREYWTENYATKSASSDEPNAMWKRRPYAQLAKCAEAQALRKAFPEFGAQPTADEMEGKHFDDDAPIVRSAADSAVDVPMPTARAALTEQSGEVLEMPLSNAKREEVPAEQQREPAQAATASTASRASTAARPPAEAKPVSESVMRILKTKLDVNGKNELDLKARFGFGFEAITSANYNEIAQWAEGRA
ncbi:phage recombination protein Bet [Paraburkholderia kururiensis]|uniref:phage recombination protein Bet n=1 Tax=Paraburkholderia kururiensis TaxID=984307 RepID=UPI0006946DB7|nr:phage recombination protein Bet [Paraburkholderia kururiensis]